MGFLFGILVTILLLVIFDYSLKAIEIDTGNILDRFEMLVKLCEETEPDIPSVKHLFSGQLIAAKEMYDRLETGVSYNENKLPALMRQANKIWKIRNKIKNGEWDSLEMLEMNDMIEDYIARGEKINAIKYYRQEMEENYDIRVSLRDAKEYIDNTAEDMRRRGIIK